MKPKLYYRTEDGVPFDNFCSDAAIGARNSDITAIGFEELPDFHPYNIVIAGVEETQAYLGREIPPINREWSKPFEKREIVKCLISEITSYPIFIKPADEVKAWTGIVVDNQQEALLFTQDYDKPVLSQPVMDIVSEYRVYVVANRGIVGVKHYLGDPYIVLDEKFVDDCYKASRVLTENAYTLDFGVNSDGDTFLIEVNDGWSIGNYGLAPDLYYSFVKNRFLQLSGVLK